MLQSKGVKRTISVVLFLAGQAVQLVPALAPYAALINSIASALGVIGLGHAGISALKS